MAARAYVRLPREVDRSSAARRVAALLTEVRVLRPRGAGQLREGHGRSEEEHAQDLCHEGVEQGKHQEAQAGGAHAHRAQRAAPRFF